MSNTAMMLALAALPLATPAFAAPSRDMQARHIEACNAIADAHEVTGYARSGFV